MAAIGKRDLTSYFAVINIIKQIGLIFNVVEVIYKRWKRQPPTTETGNRNVRLPTHLQVPSATLLLGLLPVLANPHNIPPPTISLIETSDPPLSIL